MLSQLRNAAMWVSLAACGVGIAAQQPVAAQEQETSRKITKKVDPIYPKIAQQMRLAGTVKLVLLVSPEGSVKSVRTLGGNPVLVAVAEDAVKRWKWEPAKKESNESVTLKFVAAQ